MGNGGACLGCGSRPSDLASEGGRAGATTMPMDGMDGWIMDGWMDGWTDVLAVAGVRGRCSLQSQGWPRRRELACFVYIVRNRRCSRASEPSVSRTGI